MAGLGELARDDRAPCAGAHHDDVGVVVDLALAPVIAALLDGAHRASIMHAPSKPTSRAASGCS